MLKEQASIITDLQKVLDLCITGAAFIAAYFIKRYVLPLKYHGLSTDPNYYVILLLIIIVWHISFKWMGMYISYRKSSFWQFFSAVVKSCLMGIVLLNIVLYTIHIQEISRLLMTIFLLLAIVLLTLSKLLVYIFLKKFRSNGLNTRNVLIIGCKQRAIDVIRAVEGGQDNGYIILGCLDISPGMIGNSVIGRHQIIGCVDQLEIYLKNTIVDELIFALPLKILPSPEKYLSMAEDMGIKVRIVPDWQLHNLSYQPEVAAIQFEDFSGVNTMLLQSTPLNEGKLFLKMVFDSVVGFAFFTAFLPFFIVIGAAIKLTSKGPVFYRQERLGLNGRRFTLYKFRTMVDGADQLKDTLQQLNEADGPAFKIKKDPRIIPWVGTFLRNTSLDELPQLLNVLRGEMSLVGPRPPISSEVNEYSIWQRRRLSMKPGLTCLWQIAPRRNELSFEEWMHLDLKYIDTWSLLNDFRILIMTARAVLTGAGR
jgi:exopolysaccharide biosynthesis polyprenyl glycosylphosphotransferase